MNEAPIPNPSESPTRSRFPFGNALLAQPGTLEIREYQASGGRADKEIGQPSNIVSVLYGG